MVCYVDQALSDERAMKGLSVIIGFIVKFGTPLVFFFRHNQELIIIKSKALGISPFLGCNGSIC